MFRAIISPILWSTRLCVTACGIMHRRCCRPVAWMSCSTLSRSLAGSIVSALYHKLQTHFNAPEDGRNYSPKHVELIGIINKPLLLHLVVCIIILVMHSRTNIKFVNQYLEEMQEKIRHSPENCHE